MGDRASISFRRGEGFDNKSYFRESIALFSHWDGKDLFAKADKYVRELRAERPDPSTPLGRFDPETVMIDFIRWLSLDQFNGGKQRILGNYYLGKDENDGDNSNRGHRVIDLGDEGYGKHR